MTQQEKKDSLIAAGITALSMVLIVIILASCKISMTLTPEPVLPDSTPELMADEEFLEPEILQVKGEPNAVNNDSPAPTVQGQPKLAPVENTRLVTPGKNPNPAPPGEKLVTTKHDSPITATEPSVTKEEKQEVTSKVARGFAARNGAEDGKPASSGAGGTGVGISGSAAGRTYQGCTPPSVSLRHATTVKVAVVIDASGKVIEAKASGSASPEIRKACERAAYTARWSEKKGAGESRGTLTFNITPR